VTKTYAWCFDHGRLHYFDRDPWCTARWVPLAGANLGEAIADKTARFGDAIFIDQLPAERQLELIGFSGKEQP
jgi:hypothetical protein